MGVGLKKKFLSLLAGTSGGQAIMLMSLLVTTYLYSPSDFGVLAAFAASVQLVLPAVCLRYDLAIPVPRSDRQAFALAIIALVSGLVISILYWVVLLLIKDYLSEDMSGLLNEYSWMVPVTLLFAGIFSLSQYLTVRMGLYSKLAVAHVTRGATGASLQVGLGLIGTGSLGLVIGQAAYMGLGSFGLIGFWAKREWKRLRGMRVKYLSLVSKRHWRFPVFSTPESLLDSAGVHLPVLLIIAVSGVEVGGVLYIAQRITTLPIGFIGGSLSRVYLGEARHKSSSGELFAFTRKLMLALLGVAVVLFSSIYLAVEVLQQLFPSDKWDGVGDVVACLVPASFMQFCVVPVSTIFAVKSKQYISLLVQASGLILQVGAIVICFIFELADPIAGLGIGAFFYYLIYATCAYRVAKNY